MAQDIKESVGLNGKNTKADTILVQTLLKKQGLQFGLVDGKCGPRTIAAIVTYQKSFLRQPDGLISPGGMTWRRLAGTVAPGAVPSTTRNSSPYTVMLDVPDKRTFNQGLTSPSNTTLLTKFGAPRANYSQDDQPITNEALKALMTTASVGPFRVTGMTAAVASLTLVMNDIRAALPALYGELGSAGMKCCRYQRGSTSRISNHSWGTAIDLTIAGKLDERGNNKAQTGLTLIAPYFNARGWYWGAGFGVEDGMHFECGGALIATFPSSAT